MPVVTPRSIAAALLALLVTASGCAPAIDAQLDEAQALVAAGEPMAALPLLERVVARRPDDGAANLLLGQVRLQIGQGHAALAPLAHALESERYAVPAGLLLASAHLGAGRADEALDTIGRVLTAHPDQPAALRIRATANLQTGRAEEALADAERLMEVAPDDPQGPLLLGTALTRLGRLEEAEQVLAERERATRDDDLAHANACTALATFLGAGRDGASRAEAAWADCLERHPADPTVLQGATSFFDQRGQPARSAAILERALAEQPDALGMRLALARRLAASDRTAEADALLSEHAANAPTTAPWQALALFRQERGNAEGAREALERALATPGPHEDGLRFQYANLLLDMGEHEAAGEARADIEAAGLANLLDGRLKLAAGDAEGALGAFEGAIARQPNDPRAHHLRGIAAEALGRFELALRSFGRAHELDASATDAALAGARLHARLVEPARVLDLVRRHQGARGTARGESTRLEARATAQLGQPDAARSLLERWLARNPEDGEALALVVELTEAADGAGAALARLERGRRDGIDLTDRRHRVLLQGYGRVAIRAGQADRAWEALEAAHAASPDDAELWVIEGALAAAASDPARAERSFRRAVALGPEDAVAHANLGRWLTERDRAVEALPHLERAAETAPGLHDAAYIAARILSAKGETQRAEEYLRAALAAQPLHGAAANDLAWLLAEAERELDEALALAQRASRIQPSAATLDTLGWVHLHRGEFDEAIAALEQAADRAPDAPTFRYRLGLALDRAGRRDEARAAYEKALSFGAFPEAEAARTALARLESAG